METFDGQAPGSRRYWNEAIETMPRARLAELESSRLNAQVVYTCERSAYYAERLRHAGIDPGEVKDRETLARIPFTEKSDLAAAQREGALFGPHQCAPLRDIVRVAGTGGTSGQPFRLGWTRRDVEVYNEMGARALWALGCRPGDLVVNCFNYSLYAGGVMDHMAFETLGAATLPYGVGNSRRLLAMLADMPGEVAVYATPSHAVRLAELAREEGVDLPSLGVRKGFFSGEAGLQLPGYRDRIESLFGMRAGDLYGMAEMGVQSAECAYREGLHYGGGGLVMLELIEPQSEAPMPIEAGAVGELVYTAIRREACPILRLRSHDLVRILGDTCACGRTSPRFETLGRSDDMFVVKGVNVFPLAIQQVLTGYRPRCTGEFEVELHRPPPIDYAPVLRVEVADTVAPARRAALGEELREAIAIALGFRAEVVPVAQGSIASEHKTRRVRRSYRG